MKHLFLFIFTTLVFSQNTSKAKYSIVTTENEKTKNFSRTPKKTIQEAEDASENLLPILVFSAMALVVFTATSMAGEIEETKVVSEIKTESKKTVIAQLIKVMPYCEGLFLFIRDTVISQTGNETAAEAIATASFQACVDSGL